MFAPASAPGQPSGSHNSKAPCGAARWLIRSIPVTRSIMKAQVGDLGLHYCLPHMWAACLLRAVRDRLAHRVGVRKLLLGYPIGRHLESRRHLVGRAPHGCVNGNDAPANSGVVPPEPSPSTPPPSHRRLTPVPRPRRPDLLRDDRNVIRRDERGRRPPSQGHRPRLLRASPRRSLRDHRHLLRP